MIQNIIKISDKSLEYLFLATLFLFPVSLALSNTLLGLLLIFYIINKILNKDLTIPKTIINKYILAFFIFSLLSLINTNDLQMSLDTLLSPNFKYAAFFIISYDLLNMKKLDSYINLLTYGALFLLIGGLYIDYFGNDSFFYRANGYGATGSLLLVFFLVLLIYNDKRKYKGFYVLGFLLSINAIVFSYSRGATLGLIIAVVFVLGIYLWKNLSDKFTKKQLLILIISLLIFFLIITPFILPERLISRFKNTNLNYNTNPRLLMWRTTIEMIKSHPIIGTGLGTFNHYFLYYVDNVFEGASLSTSNRGHEKPHNLYLFIAAEQGIPSLFIYLSGLFLVFKKSFKKYLESNKKNVLILSWSLLGFLVQIFIHSFVDTSVLYNHVGMYAIIFLALFIKQNTYENIKEIKNEN